MKPSIPPTMLPSRASSACVTSHEESNPATLPGKTGAGDPLDTVPNGGGNLKSPAIAHSKFPPAIYLEDFTPAKALGPLKKRIKRRYSLDSAYSLPATPADFFNFTPECALQKTLSRSDVRVPPIRTPLADLSMRPIFPENSEKNTGSEENQKESDNGRSLETRNHQGRNRNLLPNFSRSVASVRRGKRRLDGPARAQPTFVLPLHSPVSLKASTNFDASSGRSNCSLDDETPNTYMRLIRQQLEFFKLSSEDVAFCKTRNVSVDVGQVALRCRHCTCISIAFRPKGSLVVAKMHRSLYKHFNDGKNSHIEEQCPFVPKTIKKNLEALRLHKSSFPERAPFGQDFGYWCQKAEAEGVVETREGLRFKSSLMTEKSSDLVSLQDTSENSVCQSPRLYPGTTKSFAQGRPNQLVQKKKSTPIEGPVDWWKDCNVSENPNSTLRHPFSEADTKQCDERNQQEESNHTTQQMQETPTLRQQAAMRTWHERLLEFIDFKDRNGHGQVPQNFPENRRLGIWVNKQRAAKRAKDDGKASSMTDERVKLLEAVGFSWGKPKGRPCREENFRELETFS